MKKKFLSTVLFSLLVVFTFLFAEKQAFSVVSQIDGTIVPTSNLLQNELDNQGESLNAVVDAQTFPQIFMPAVNGDGNRLVYFEDIQEEAGYENTFGWYNINDPSQLYKIFDCSDEPYDSIVIDFDNQYSLGNWTGGFIGFFLITPEDNNAGNCGDFNPPENFGHIYYSEPELNGDGDYVHHIVFTSSIDPNTFYFAFEDLYRGGDNDFSDMTIKVQGLVPPCVPEPEICDGQDNDCDGEIDENSVDVGDPCESDTGECTPGTTVCDEGAIICQGFIGPQPEVCEGFDNDCDGTVDNSPIDEGGSCGTNEGICTQGSYVCSGGSLVCSGNTSPEPEICDGSDNDCDGIIDNNLTDTGSACGSDQGECQSGVTACISGTLECQGEIAPVSEICDGLDNDCNGASDDSPIDVGEFCGSDTGECEAGLTVCESGVIVCSGAVESQPEACDGLDNDCNGLIDDNTPDEGDVCGNSTGQCQAGTLVCSGGSYICQGSTEPQPEACDGLDNDCDGTVDNNLTDTGDQCGSDTGECQSGVYDCISGSLTCVGSIGPQIEACDGLDNDCNGNIDDNPQDINQPCGEDTGTCTPGMTVCIDGNVECQNSMGPETEQCDGLDNNCNGLIDESNPEGGEICGVSDTGICEMGVTVCQNGTLSCQGSTDPQPEVCNNLDDNCDGIIDNGDLCPQGAECIEGQCRIYCGSGEFSCPGGTECIDDYCEPNECYEVECPDGFVCQEGTCVDLCENVECENDEICQNGICKENNCYGLGCPNGEICFDSECTEDPCQNTQCESDEFCSLGECVKTCERVICADGEKCVSGNCINEPCAQINCENGQICQDGQCLDNPCSGVFCSGDRICQQGSCVDNPCHNVDCPLGGICSEGQCYNHPDYIPGEEGDTITTNGNSLFGCNTSTGNSSSESTSLLALILFFGLFAVSFFKKKLSINTKFFSSIFLIFLLLGSCQTSSYKIPDEDGSMPDVPDSDASCTITNDGVEICDGLDNDCNGIIDDGLDLNNDINNCGECSNVCDLFGAYNQCSQGTCTSNGCAPGYFDLNNDMEDGCEYECLPTNGGLEICDGLDNDCNGITDEDFLLDSDPDNCGSCSNQCSFPYASSTCEGGNCLLLECNNGFKDLNDNPDDGCEYSCFISNDGTEICDGLDNDCNGQVDDGVDTLNDPQNCGACWNSCNRLHSQTTCNNGQCELLSCNSGYTDANNDLADGCEYECTLTNGGTEICDSLDNDCNGQIDDNPADVGGNCGSNTGTCSYGTLICSNGTINCSGAVGSQSETCDGLDNDCDGQIDEDLAQEGSPCGTSLGACEMGTWQCNSGSFECLNAIEPQPETCNGIDDDCDGIVDNSLTDTGGSCGTDTGACQSGTETCLNGSIVCSGEIAPSTEICDGLDNNCNSNVDDNTIDTGDLCGSSVGECSPGTTECIGGTVVCSSAVDPQSEVCDGLDNNCNGLIDDGTMVGVGVQCGTTNVGECQYGSTICQAGSTTCSGNIEPESWDLCDGLDTDCDGANDPSGCLSVAGNDIRLDANSSAGSSNSIQLDIDALGDVVHVVWADRRNGNADIFHTCSVDGGITWTDDLKINNDSTPSVKPKVVVDPANNGYAYIAYEDNRSGSDRDIYLVKVNDCTASGATYSSEIRVDSGNIDSLNIHMIADGSGHLYLTWEEFVEGTGTESGYRNINFVASSDYGSSFTSPARVNQEPADQTQAYASTPRLALGNNNRVFVVWSDNRNGASDIYLNYTDDLGSSFPGTDSGGSDIRLDTDAAGTGASKFPHITSDESDMVIVVWQDLRNDISSDIYINRSTDNGETWNSSDLQLDADGNDSNSYEPMILTDKSGYIFVSWQDFRAGLPNMRFIVSSDNGASFTSSLPIAQGTGFVEKPRLAINGSGLVYGGFLDDRDGLRDVYANFSLDYGVTFQPEDLRLDLGSLAGESDSFGLRVAAGKTNNKFYLVWVDTRTDGINGDIYFNSLVQ
ncbi:MAG: MopE-related protein [Deltaproteobacteria bacterium]|jgi:Notch-like protein|nr:MopE-related protein [Deltaproteobacteria bacterium]